MSADPMAVVGLGAAGAGLGLPALVYGAPGLARVARRRRRMSRTFPRGHLRLVPTGSYSRPDCSPPAAADRVEPGTRPQAPARVGSPADLTRANHSSRGNLPLRGAVEVAGVPDQVPPHRGRDSRGRGFEQGTPASTTTSGNLSNATPGTTPSPVPGVAFRAFPRDDQAGQPHTQSCAVVGLRRRPQGLRSPAGPSDVDGRSRERPLLNTAIPRPLLPQEQPGDHDNGRG